MPVFATVTYKYSTKANKLTGMYCDSEGLYKNNTLIFSQHLFNWHIFRGHCGLGWAVGSQRSIRKSQ